MCILRQLFSRTTLNSNRDFLQTAPLVLCCRVSSLTASSSQGVSSLERWDPAAICHGSETDDSLLEVEER